jgi:methanogenic corrinoid protein MtbC1
LAIGGGPEGDPYVLANLMAEMVLLDLGWEVTNLGPNTPLASLVAATAANPPRLVWLSISQVVDREIFLKQYIELFQNANRRGIAIAVGGLGLTEELRVQMPYTSFGDGLTHLAAFARSLYPTAPRTDPGRPRRISRNVSEEC